MRFWDSSALVALVVEEPASAACRRALRADGSIGAWALTRTEMVSAVQRRRREADLDAKEARAALRRIEVLAGHWTEVDALEPVRERAERLLSVHPLRAADALQLAAALVLTDDRPRRLDLVTSDEQVALAAEAEGFRVVVPEAR